MINNDAAQSFPQLKILLTPEEKQILGLSEEDISSFADESIQLTPQEILLAIEDIISSAYDNSPAFKKMVDTDAAKDPQRLRNSAQIVSKFLKHLKGLLPIDKSIAIKEDAFIQAHTMIQDILSDNLKKPAAAPIQEPTFDPTTEAELDLFKLPGTNFTLDNLKNVGNWSQVKDNVLYFLGKLRDPNKNNRLVKNEATKSMPDDLKIIVLAKFLNTIRNAKLERSNGVLNPVDIRWLGKNLHELQTIAKTLVTPSPAKMESTYDNDLIEVNSGIADVVPRIDRIQEIFKDKKFTDNINSLITLVDSALPSVNLFEDRIQDIQEKVNELGLTRNQVAALTEVDTRSLSYELPIKKILEDQNIALKNIDKEISEKGETEDLKTKKNNIISQIKSLEDLNSKDLSALVAAIKDYYSTLKTFRNGIKENISNSSSNNDPIIKDFVKLITSLALWFNRLYREQLFKARWNGKSGFLIRKDNPQQNQGATPTGQETPNTPEVSKTAAEGSTYAAKLEQYRGKGLLETYKDLSDIIESPDKLQAIKEKLLSILELKPENTLNSTGQDYTNNPLGGQGPSLDDALKLMATLRTLARRITIEDKAGEAYDILDWAASLQKHIKGSGKSKSTKEKMASASYFLRKIARVILGEESYFPKTPEGAPDRYQSPGGSGSEAPHSEPGNAGWFIYRQRMTKFGKKALKGFFDEPNFIPDFVEEMEKQGLNKMYIKGEYDTLKGKLSRIDSEIEEGNKAGNDTSKLQKEKEKVQESFNKLKPMFDDPNIEKNIEKALEAVIQKSTGKTGNLENILESKLMQKFRSEYDRKKTVKELEEARSRVNEIESKINETEDKFLPKLEEYGRFISDPIGATTEQLEDLRAMRTDKKDTNENNVTKDLPEVEPVYPEAISLSNYRSVLMTLRNKYKDSGTPTGILEPEKGPVPEGILKKACRVLFATTYSTSTILPIEFEATYKDWLKKLSNIKAISIRQNDPTKRARYIKEYYEILLITISKLKEFFDYQSVNLRADQGTINNLERFINSDAVADENPRHVQDAKKSLEVLKYAFKKELDFLNSLKAKHNNLNDLKKIADVKLNEIDRDLKDNIAEQVYQIAISPELNPDKDVAQAITKKYKEHQEGLSYLIDRSVYKKNMNKITTYKSKRDKFEWPEWSDSVKILPPERKKELEDSLKDYLKNQAYLKEVVNYEMKKVALNKMSDDLARLKKNVINGKELIDTFTGVLENVDMLKKGLKDGSISQEDFDKQMATLISLTKDDKLTAKTIKKELEYDVKNEKDYIEKIEKYVADLEVSFKKAKEDLETTKPNFPVSEQIKRIMDQLHRLRVLDIPGVTKPFKTEVMIEKLEDKANKLQDMKGLTFDVAPGSKEEQDLRIFKRELDHQIDINEQSLKKYKEQLAIENRHTNALNKQSSMDDPDPKADLSPLEKALEVKGTKPAPYMDELKKPRGWEFVEEFFDKVRKEHKLRRKQKEDNLVSPLRVDFMRDRLDQLENMEDAIDAYKDQLLDIGGDTVAFRDIMMKFEQTLDEYQSLLRKYVNQKEDAKNRVLALRQELEHLDALYDPETGEFKGLDKEEIDNLKSIFIRMIYKELETYWATKIGKDLSVFGERSSDWYDRAYKVFRNVGGVRSNKKILGLINKYKQETRSDFDDIFNRYKSQDLRKRLDVIIRKYKELAKDSLAELNKKREDAIAKITAAGKDPKDFPAIAELDKKISNLTAYGTDPTKSESIQELLTRISTLEKQEKQIDLLFKAMTKVDQTEVNIDSAKEMLGQANKNLTEEDKPANEKVIAKLEEKQNTNINEAADLLEKDLDDLINSTKLLDEVDTALSNGEKKLGIISPEVAPKSEEVSKAEEPSGKKEEKTAFDKNHPDFNLNLLYGKYMQATIQKMLGDSI